MGGDKEEGDHSPSRGKGETAQGIGQLQVSVKKSNEIRNSPKKIPPHKGGFLKIEWEWWRGDAPSPSGWLGFIPARTTPKILSNITRPTENICNLCA